jgi:hypothetical protein
MPLIPVAEMQELDAMLAEGDAAALRDGEHEPVPSGFFDEIEEPTTAR